MQTFITLLATVIVDDADDLKQFITAVRITRLVFVLVGIVQSLRKQISYYHLLALSITHYLLGIPEQFLLFMDPYIQRHLHSFKFEPFLNLTRAVLATLINLSLAFLSIHMEHLSKVCHSSDPQNQLILMNAPDVYSFTGNGFANGLMLLIYLLVDIIVAASSFVMARNPTPARMPKFFSYSFFHHVFLAILTMTTLQYTIFWLYAVGDKSQQDWSAGQIVAFATISITSLFQWTDYACNMSKVDPTCRRYRHWCRKCMCTSLVF
jgi:hypothetical protein